MRVVGVLALLAAVAFGEDHPELRKLIDSFRGEKEREQIQLVFPKQVAALPKGARLAVEFLVGHHLVGYGVIWFDPMAGGKVRVTRIERRRCPDDGTPVDAIGIDVSSSEVVIEHAQYAALVRDLLLLRDVTQLRKKGTAGTASWRGLTTEGWARPEVVADGKRDVWGDDMLSAGKSREDEQFEEFDDAERGLLFFERISRALIAWKPKRVPNSDAAAARLLEDLTRVGSGRERPEWSTRFRAHVLGSLGYRPALPVFRKLESFGEEYAEMIGPHRRQIEILHAKDAAPLLLAEINHQRDGRLIQWATTVLRVRYPDAYAARAVRRFDSEAAAVRRNALAELREVRPMDLTLARRGLRDPSAAIRVESAEWMWRVERDDNAAKLLLEIARNRDRRSEADCLARVQACAAVGEIGSLTATYAARSVLTAILTNVDEDVRVRGGAARGLGLLGNPSSIALLREQLRAPPPTKPVYYTAQPNDYFHSLYYLSLDDMRCYLACALGNLVAEEAVPDLMGFLRAEPTRSDAWLRTEAGRALAIIGSPKARAILEKERVRWGDDDMDELRWKEYVDLIDLLNAGDGGERLLGWKSDWEFPSAALSIHLARLCTVDQLRQLKVKFPARRAEIDAALARKRG